MTTKKTNKECCEKCERFDGHNRKADGDCSTCGNWSCKCHQQPDKECEVEKKTGGHYFTEGGSKMCCEQPEKEEMFDGFEFDKVRIPDEGKIPLHPEPSRENWRSKVFNLVAKLDNGSHSANQLQGIDESITELISQTLLSERTALVEECLKIIDDYMEHETGSSDGWKIGRKALAKEIKSLFINLLQSKK